MLTHPPARRGRNSAAAAAGLLPGAILLAVDGVGVARAPVTEVQQRLRDALRTPRVLAALAGAPHAPARPAAEWAPESPPWDSNVVRGPRSLSFIESLAAAAPSNGGGGYGGGNEVDDAEITLRIRARQENERRMAESLARRPPPRYLVLRGRGGGGGGGGSMDGGNDAASDNSDPEADPLESSTDFPEEYDSSDDEEAASGNSSSRAGSADMSMITALFRELDSTAAAARGVSPSDEVAYGFGEPEPASAPRPGASLVYGFGDEPEVPPPVVARPLRSALRLTRPDRRGAQAEPQKRVRWAATTIIIPDSRAASPASFPEEPSDVLPSPELTSYLARRARAAFSPVDRRPDDQHRRGGSPASYGAAPVRTPSPYGTSRANVFPTGFIADQGDSRL